MRSTRPVRWAVPLVVAGSLVLAACGNSTSGSGSAAGSSSSSGGGLGGGSGSGATYKIAFEGPLSGDNQQLGINEVNAAQLAIDQANATGDLGFKLKLVKADDQGDPARRRPPPRRCCRTPPCSAWSARRSPVPPRRSARPTARPAWPDHHAVGDQRHAEPAGLHHLPPDRPDRQRRGHRRPPTGWPGRATRRSSSSTTSPTTARVSPTRSPSELKAKGVTVSAGGATPRPPDYGAIAQTVAASGAQAMFYGGYDAQAALLAKALQAAGYNGVRSGNGGKSSVFTKGAGAAGDGWYFTCGCSDATTAPGGQGLHRGVQAKFNTAPSTYSPEAYDATNAMIQAIKTAAKGGTPTRQRSRTRSTPSTTRASPPGQVRPERRGRQRPGREPVPAEERRDRRCSATSRSRADSGADPRSI